MNSFSINCRGKLHTFSGTVVMGIVNCTDDSFFSESRCKDLTDVLKKTEKHIQEGAAIIDLGAVSTRPGSVPCSEQEELKKLLPAVSAVAKEFPEIIISVDTFRSQAVKNAYEEGAGMVNDISGGEMDDTLFETIIQLRMPYVLMHMQGRPENMQKNPVYRNVVSEVIQSLIIRAEKLKQAGHADVILDPGFGFGKTAGHNFELLKNLDLFSMLGYPLLAGLSRKSMIWRTLAISPEEALNGTSVLNTVAILKGASILRVHDTKEAVQSVRLLEMLH